MKALAMAVLLAATGAEAATNMSVLASCVFTGESSTVYAFNGTNHVILMRQERIWPPPWSVSFETKITTNMVEISDAVVGCMRRIGGITMTCALFGCDHKESKPATWREVRRVVTETRTVIIRADGEERRFVWSEKTLSDTVRKSVPTNLLHEVLSDASPETLMQFVEYMRSKSNRMLRSISP